MTQLPASLAIRPGQTVGRIRFQLFDSSDDFVEDATAASFTSFQLWQKTDQVESAAGSPVALLVDGADNTVAKAAGTVIHHGYNVYSIDLDLSAVTGEAVFVRAVVVNKGEYILSTEYILAELSEVTGYSTHNAADVVSAMQAVANDFKADVANLALETSVQTITTNFSAWVETATGAALTSYGAATTTQLSDAAVTIINMCETPVGFSTHSVTDVVNALLVEANSFKANLADLETKAEADIRQAALLSELASTPGDVVTAMQSVADDFKATGYSTHDAGDVVTAMQAVADNFKTDLTLALLQAELTDLIAHGDVTWVGGGGSATEEKQDLILANLAQAIIVVRNPTYNSGLSLGPLFLGATYSVATLNPINWTAAIDFDLTGWTSCLHIGPEKFYGTLSSTQAVVEILEWGQLCAKTHKWVLTAYKDNVHVPLGAGTVEVLELGQNS